MIFYLLSCFMLMVYVLIYVHIYIMMCTDYIYDFYLVRVVRDLHDLYYQVAAEIVPPSVYEEATNIDYVPPPIMEWDLVLFNPYIRLQVVYESLRRHVH